MADNPIFSYTKRDYESSRQEGLAKIPTLSQGNWTDLNVSDPGVIILDYVHALVDMINFYQDHQALETFIPTAKERVNLFRLASQFAYKIPSAKGALCEVTFTLGQSFDSTILIPKYTKVSTSSCIQYLTLEDSYINPGDISIDILCVQGSLNNFSYQGTGISKLSNVYGAKDQSIRVAANNIDIDSIVVKDATGKIWKPVDYIVFSSKDEKVYQSQLNPDDSVTILFGDGERGRVPQTSDYLTITYTTSLAEEGRVNENTIINLDTEILDDQGRYIPISVNNNNASSGGSSTMSSIDIREKLPALIKTQDRAVTLTDFETLAKSVSGVYSAKAFDINIDPGCNPHEVKVVIIPEKSESSLELLKNRVREFLVSRMIPPTNLYILSPSYEKLNIDIVVRKSPDISANRLQYIIEKTVIDYFDQKKLSIGSNYYPAELSAMIYNLSEVQDVISITPTKEIKAASVYSSFEIGKLNIEII